jgi:endonuclease YncB( thermonuclease family)
VLLDEDGKTYSVRYIGMDTPENTSQVEYFGPEATAKNSELVYGKSVTLIKDVSETDPFGRLLRYVIADGLFVNYELVAQGFANTTSYPPDIACIPIFQLAEQQASTTKVGLWNAPPTVAPLIQPTIVVVPQQPLSNPNSCCKVCGSDSQPCGDSCISLRYTCHQPPGCACK